MLDEFILGGEVQDSSKKTVLSAIAQMDLLQEVSIRVTLSTVSSRNHTRSFTVLRLTCML